MITDVLPWLVCFLRLCQLMPVVIVFVQHRLSFKALCTPACRSDVTALLELYCYWILDIASGYSSFKHGQNLFGLLCFFFPLILDANQKFLPHIYNWHVLCIHEKN